MALLDRGTLLSQPPGAAPFGSALGAAGGGGSDRASQPQHGLCFSPPSNEKQPSSRVRLIGSSLAKLLALATEMRWRARLVFPHWRGPSGATTGERASAACTAARRTGRGRVERSWAVALNVPHQALIFPGNGRLIRAAASPAPADWCGSRSSRSPRSPHRPASASGAGSPPSTSPTACR